MITSTSLQYEQPQPLCITSGALQIGQWHFPTTGNTYMGKWLWEMVMALSACLHDLTRLAWFFCSVELLATRSGSTSQSSGVVRVQWIRSFRVSCMYCGRRALLINEDSLIDWLINPLECFFSIEDHEALGRNPWPGYNTLFLWLIPGYFYSACPNRQFHTLPCLLHSQAALPNSFPNVYVASRDSVCTICMMVSLSE